MAPLKKKKKKKKKKEDARAEFWTLGESPLLYSSR